MPRRYNKMPPLTTEAERALRESIKKWEYLSSGEATSEPDCALCEIWNNIKSDCSGCPLSMRTGTTCYDDKSPYDRWLCVSGDTYNSPNVMAAAKQMLRILRDTLRLGLKARERNSK